MTLVGKPAPAFEMPSTKNLDRLNEPVRLQDYRGQWLVFFFYPADFTFVCPTEIRALSERFDDFKDLGADILGCSVDSVYVHRAWIKAPRDGDPEGLGPINYPLASDPTHEVARRYGVLDEGTGTALRGLFIIDPDGIVRYQVVHEDAVGRSVDETLRVLQALQTGEMCGAGWRPGQQTLTRG